MAVVLDVALDSLILEPFAVLLTDVTDVPLTSAEPSGTLLALQDVLLVALTVALPV